MDVYALQLVLLLMIFVRVSALVSVAPVFGHIVVPVQVKAGLSAFLTFVLYPATATSAPALDLRLAALVLVAMKEVLVGLLLGFATGLIFAGARSAGELLAYELGLSISFVTDPESGQNTVMSEFFYLFLVLVFLLVNGHHFVLEALRLSYATVPVDGLTLGGAAGQKLISLTGMVFVVAIKIAAPVLVSSFLINVGMSILSRVAPQMNVFVLSFPLKIAVGIAVLMTAAPVIIYVFKKLLAGFESDVLELLKVI